MKGTGRGFPRLKKESKNKARNFLGFHITSRIKRNSSGKGNEIMEI
jgi:hypothetical protein